MANIFSQWTDPLLLIGLSAGLFISYSITTLDKRPIQGKKDGLLPDDEPMLPSWVGFFHILDWFLLVAMLILNWKVGLAIWLVFFVLKVLPVFETIGSILMRPFRPRVVK